MRPLRLIPDEGSTPDGAPVSRRRPGAPPLESLSDTELLQVAGRGNTAIGVFYRRHVDEIVAYFWHRTRDQEATADLTSETFAVALESIDKFDPTLGEGGQWLQGIAANLLKKFWRRNKASDKARRNMEMQVISLEDSAAKELDDVETLLDGERLLVALQQVPTKNRQAVFLRLVENLSYAQIASNLSCTPGAARVRVLRGLRHLQHTFDQSPTSGVDAS